MSDVCSLPSIEKSKVGQREQQIAKCCNEIARKPCYSHPRPEILPPMKSLVNSPHSESKISASQSKSRRVSRQFPSKILRVSRLCYNDFVATPAPAPGRESFCFVTCLQASNQGGKRNFEALRGSWVRGWDKSITDQII